MSEENRLIDEDTPMITIGNASKILGVSVHTLRMYEREGLIIPIKKDSNHRLYSQYDINRLKCIRDAITKMKFSIQAIKNLYSMVPCWAIIDCSENDRNNCKAYNSHGEPCWSITHTDNKCASLSCRDCKVYKDYSDCSKIKDSIKNYTR